MGLASSRSNRKRITHNGVRYQFSNSHADYVINFFEKVLTHSQGKWAGQPFSLIPYQEEFLSEVFGWVDKTGNRMVRSAYLELPKKNGKSPLASGVGLFLLVADNEPGAMVYVAASDKEQAGIVYGYGRDAVLQSDLLRSRLKVIDSRKRIVDMATGSVMIAVSSDVPSKHGPNLHGLIFDELHAQKNRELWDTLVSGTGAAREQALAMAITTAGVYEEDHICWEQHQYAMDVIKDPMSDPSHYAMVFTADRDADWRDEKVWAAANPALGIFRNIDQLRTEASKAERSPAYQNTFRRLYLDQWTAQVERWIDTYDWEQSAGEVHEDDLEGEVCYAGLDLSSRIDLTAWVMVFPDEDGSYDVLARFWMPEDTVQERVRRDRVPYDVWVAQGLITATPGRTVRYEDVLDGIAADAERFHVAEAAFDRWGAGHISERIEDRTGITMVQFGQGWASMSEPSKALIDLTAERKLRNGNNPVLNWNAECTAVRQDAAGNIKPVKPDRRKSSKRIDGIVALIMALSLSLRGEGESIYENRGLSIVGGE